MIKRNGIIIYVLIIILTSSCSMKHGGFYDNFKRIYIEAYYIPFTTCTVVPVTKEYLLTRYEYKVNIETYYVCLNNEFKEILNDPGKFSKVEYTRLTEDFIDYRLYCKVYVKDFFLFKRKIIEYGIGYGKVIINNKTVINNNDIFIKSISPFLPQ